MARLVIQGQRPLRGEIRVAGAKNAALPMLAASLLTGEEVVFDNVPDIEDIHTIVELLGHVGADVQYTPAEHQVRVNARNINNPVIPPELAAKARASFLLVGPLTGRLGRAMAPHPGGCAIGSRPVNVDVKGLADMGATVVHEGEYYAVRAPGRLRGNKVYLDYPSHTGTENLLMAAVLAKGKTVIKHAAAEPEVSALADLLSAMGANIKGAGTSIIEVEGVDELHGVRYTVVPDRIESGTFAIAAAISGGELSMAPAVMAHMDPLTHKLREVGVEVEDEGEAYRVRGGWQLTPTELQTLPYPGFPTDLQACFSTLLTQADGMSIVHERVYDNRLQYSGELAKMGARMEVEGQSARIFGPAHLKGARVRALDLRAGAALVLAALAADGETVIEDVHHLERGYEDIVSKLTAVGASIRREQ
ncbi:MAG: UDP-N-acetylglucosamine 1-carboxyvinyltransferase [Chloroflexota bacterium]